MRLIRLASSNIHQKHILFMFQLLDLDSISLQSIVSLKKIYSPRFPMEWIFEGRGVYLYEGGGSALLLLLLQVPWSVSSPGTGGRGEFSSKSPTRPRAFVRLMILPGRQWGFTPVTHCTPPVDRQTPCVIQLKTVNQLLLWTLYWIFLVSENAPSSKLPYFRGCLAQ